MKGAVEKRVPSHSYTNSRAGRPAVGLVHHIKPAPQADVFGLSKGQFGVTGIHSPACHNRAESFKILGLALWAFLAEIGDVMRLADRLSD